MTEFEKNENERNMMQDMEHEAEDTKNSNGKFWKGVLTGALVTAFVGILVVMLAAGIFLVGRSVKTQKVQESQAAQNADEKDSHTEDSLDLSVIGPKLKYIEHILDQYFLFDEEDEDETGGTKLSAEDWIYTAYVMSFNDPYTSYYTAENYQSMMEEIDGEYCGVGVLVSQNVYTGVIQVLKVFKDAPADIAGMLPGDQITAVDGESVTGMDLSLVVSEHIKGEEGTDVVVTVYRESEEKTLDLTMTRAIVQNPTVEFEMLENQIGYINLSSFDDVSTEQFISAAEELESRGMKALVLDIRNNSGGLVTTAEAICDYILPDGKEVVSFKGKGVEDSNYITKDGHQMDIPIAILVNGQSASASEILSGALGYHDSAVLVGTKTFGKGIAQGIFPLQDGSAVKLTTAYYYLPSGECIHEKGVEPDVEVELKEELKTMVEIPKEDDNQLQTAIRVLLEGEEKVKADLEAERVAAEAAGELEAETEAGSESENAAEK